MSNKEVMLYFKDRVLLKMPYKINNNIINNKNDNINIKLINLE